MARLIALPPGMRRGWLVGLALACGCGDTKPVEPVPPPPPPPDGPIDARIDHYDVELDLATRVATVKLTIVPLNAGNCVTIPYRSTLENDVTLDDVIATASVLDGELTACGPARPKDAVFVLATTITLADKTLPPTQIGFSLRDDFSYLLSWVGGCDLVMPCDSRSDRFATSRFTIHHEPDVVVRCPGTIDTTDPTTTVCDFGFEGGPTYSTIGFVAARGWKIIDAGVWSGIAVSIYDRSEHGIAEQIVDAEDYYRGFLDFMISRFGPYPYGGALRILTGPTYWNGFEHPGNIVLSQYLPHTGSPFTDPLAHIVTHEIAHMWAGNQTTIATPHDFVWKEAMVEYLTYVYEDSIDPERAATTLRVWRMYAEAASHYPVPDDKPPLVDYYADVYGPGPMILFRQIERLSSRDSVMAAIGSLLGRERAIGVDDVRGALEVHTGLDLDRYFDAWVYGRGAPAWPVISATYADGRLVVTQTNAGYGEGMPCRFDVALHGKRRGDVIKVDVDMFRGGASQTIAASPAFDIDHTVIDPDGACLAFEAKPSTIAGLVDMSSEARSFTATAEPPRPKRERRARGRVARNPWVATPP